VLDVRAPGERHDKYIDGSVPLPLNRLKRHLDEVPRDRQVVVQCAGGSAPPLPPVSWPTTA
jgi:hypothetical protein